jgi:hypothetical protein
MCSVPRGCPVSASSQCCAHGLDPLRALPSQRTQSDCACGFVQGASARVNLKTIASDSLTQTSPTANGSGKRTMMTSLSRCHCPSPSSSPSLTSSSHWQERKVRTCTQPEKGNRHVPAHFLPCGPFALLPFVLGRRTLLLLRLQDPVRRPLPVSNPSATSLAQPKPQRERRTCS